MKRKTLLTLLGCMFAMSGILVALYASSSLSKEIYRGPFERNFKPGFIEQKAVLDLKYNSYYFAGATDNNIYLSNTTSPLHMITAPLDLADTQHVELNLVGIDSIKSPLAFRTVVDSPYVYMFHGTMPFILRGEVNSWNVDNFMGDQEQPYFAEAVPVGKSSFALRYYNTVTKQFDLGKRIIDSPYFDTSFNLLKKQLDGLFCVDGKLHFDKVSSKTIYLYSYRNQFVVADTSLNLSYVGHTIDTFSHVRIKVAQIGSNDNMLSAPPVQTNLLSTVSGNHLYVQSNILAKNEDKEKFMNNEVIDVYELTTGQYQYSFYVPRYGGKRMLHFRVIGSQLLAINDRYLIQYDKNWLETL